MRQETRTTEFPDFGAQFNILHYHRWQVEHEPLILTPMELLHGSRSTVMTHQSDLELLIESCDRFNHVDGSHAESCTATPDELRAAVERFTSVHALRVRFLATQDADREHPPQQAGFFAYLTQIPPTSLALVKAVMSAWGSRLVSLEVDAQHLHVE
jgi:hypothetical protein